MIAFAAPRRRRRPSLTPMIDVVFLLLVFFLLAARFAPEDGIDLRLAGAAGPLWQGAPRLVDVGGDGLALNGVEMGEAMLLAELARLGGAAEPVVLRPGPGTDLGRLVAAMEALRRAGFTRLLLAEGG